MHTEPRVDGLLLQRYPERGQLGHVCTQAQAWGLRCTSLYWDRRYAWLIRKVGRFLVQNEVKAQMEEESNGGISSEAAAAVVGDDDGVSIDEAEKAARILMMPPVMRNRVMVDQLVALTARNAFLKDLVCSRPPDGTLSPAATLQARRDAAKGCF